MGSLYTKQLMNHLQLFEERFPQFLPTKDGYTDEENLVFEAMRYACEGGGKRLRPVLVLEFCRLCGGDPVKAIPFAAAVEMIHSYSLVHDDLPCMDNSPLRRGKPSTHAVYGETMALLTGDALLNRAFEVALNAESVDDLSARAALKAACILADFSGIYGMIGGQVIDLGCEGKAIGEETLRRLQEKKTAALIRAACQMGCVIGGGDREQQSAAGEFGMYLGLAFQVIDDILDVTATEQQLGKPVGSDEENAKNTYVSLLGLEAARQLAQDYTEKAIAALQLFGPKKQELEVLAQALLSRVA